MLKTTQREIKEFDAEEVKTTEQAFDLYNCSDFRRIAYSNGTYGCNGLVFYSLGKFWKVCSNNTVLSVLN